MTNLLPQSVSHSRSWPRFRATVSWPDRLVLVSLAALSVHLIDAATFHAQRNAGAFEQTLQFLAAVAVVPGLVLAYFRLGPKNRGFFAVLSGMPMLFTGIAIHIVGTIKNGYGSGDATGITMAFAGLALIVVGIGKLEAAIPRWRYRIATVPLVVPFLLFGLLPGTMIVYVTHAPRYEITPVDLGAPYEDVEFQTADGVTIRGWYVPSKNGAAVVVSHGSGGARIRPLLHGQMLVRNGYGVLMYDTRGHGTSGGTTNALGWQGARDATAALAFLEGRDDVEPGRVGILGLSMGAEIAIDAAAHGAVYGAVVADGAGVRSIRDLMDLESVSTKLVSGPVMLGMTIGTMVLQQDLPPKPSSAFVDQIESPILYIAGDISEERDLNQQWFAKTKATRELWEVDAGHTGGLKTYPEEYERRVIAWFDTHLLQQAR